MIQQTFDLRLATLATGYRNDDTTPRTLLATIRQRVETLNPEFNLFIHLLSEAEQAPSLAVLRGHSSGTLPLYGVPFAIKDNTGLTEIVTTVACPVFAYWPTRNATIIAQLITLEVMPVGKTNLDQFTTSLNGTRSPYGRCRDVYHPVYPFGGSNTGSTLAVALDVASFALGIDTIGNGRVPAGLSNLMGLKATKGVISTAGIVPACRTLDYVALLSTTADEANQLLALVIRADSQDGYSRHSPQWNSRQAFGRPSTGFCFGVPQMLNLLGCHASEALLTRAVQRLTALGGVLITADFTPFLAATHLPYDRPWIAERCAMARPLIEQQPDAVLSMIRDMLAKAPDVGATAISRAMYQLQGYKT